MITFFFSKLWNRFYQCFVILSMFWSIFSRFPFNVHVFLYLHKLTGNNTFNSQLANYKMYLVKLGMHVSNRSKYLYRLFQSILKKNPILLSYDFISISNDLQRSILPFLSISMHKNYAL